MRRKNPRFGERISKRRKELGLSQREVAQHCKYSRPYQNRIESGDSPPPSREKVMTLANLLNFDHFELLQAASKEQSFLSENKRQFPRSLALAEMIIVIMKEDEKNARRLVKFENRLWSFDEDPIKLAENFGQYFLGVLSLKEEPKNGLKPLQEYFKP